MAKGRPRGVVGKVGLTGTKSTLPNGKPRPSKPKPSGK